MHLRIARKPSYAEKRKTERKKETLTFWVCSIKVKLRRDTGVNCDL